MTRKKPVNKLYEFELELNIGEDKEYKIKTIKKVLFILPRL